MSLDLANPLPTPVRAIFDAESEDAVIAHAARARLRLRQYLVPGKPHFYDREAKIVLKHATMPGGEGCDTVETAMVEFLDEALG